MDYSAEFEQCWAEIIAARSGDCFLEGTSQTIAELLTPTWELVDCARCSMPIPLLITGIPAENCNCADLPGWPNTEVPAPTHPLAMRSKLANLQDRLGRAELK